MSNEPNEPYTGLSLDGIEVVELSEVDLDFTVEEVFGKRAAAAAALDAETTRAEPATADDLRTVELFRGLSGDEVAALAPRCQSIYAVPGYVLLAPGRLNNKIYFVLEGQLRVYPQTNEKRPIAIADVGQSTGLRPALVNQPVNHAIIATEMSHVLAVEVATLDEFVQRSHVLARNYATLLTSYLRGDNCLHITGRPPGATNRQGYVDELTLLHNQHWLNTVLPRLIARAHLGSKRLAVVAFAIDRLDDMIKAHGIGGGLHVLGAVGHWLLDQTRPTDLLAVTQNRCILAFLPDNDLAGARVLASRIRADIGALVISLAAGKTIKVTLSLGVTELEKGMKESDLLSKLDGLIRKSVALGGNRLSETL